MERRRNKGKEAEVKIVSFDENGDGIAYIGKQSVTVKHALPNETMRIDMKQEKGKWIGKIIELKTRNPHRCEVLCKEYERCGSCHLLHLDYQKQLQYKKQTIIQMLKHEGLDKLLHVHDVVGMEHPYAYRNKVIIGFQKDRNRKTIAGFYEEDSHRIVPFQSCLLQDDISNHIISVIVELVNRMHIEPYEEDARKGVLRHVLIRRGFISNQTMVVFVTNQSMFAGSRNLIQELRKRCPEITTIVQNVNPRKTSIVLGNQEKVLYGKGYIEDELCGYRFRISPKSFYQINHEQCEKLYAKAKELARPKANECALDAYCGIGTIGMSMSDGFCKVYGVEANQDAIHDANVNAKINHVQNMEFVCADAGNYLSEMAKQNMKLDVLIMDPPRSGSDMKFLTSAIKAGPNRIVYISCNPTTQARDIKVLMKAGYIAHDLYLYDLFPNTNAIESVMLLEKSANNRKKK